MKYKEKSKAQSDLHCKLCGSDKSVDLTQSQRVFKKLNKCGFLSWFSIVCFSHIAHNSAIRQQQDTGSTCLVPCTHQTLVQLDFLCKGPFPLRRSNIGKIPQIQQNVWINNPSFIKIQLVGELQWYLWVYFLEIWTEQGLLLSFASGYYVKLGSPPISKYQWYFHADIEAAGPKRPDQQLHNR